MRKDKFEKKLEKLGLTWHDDGRKCYIHKDGQVCSWRWESEWRDIDGQYQETGEQSASGFHVRRENDHTDTMTDYFAGYFLENATQFCNTIVPPTAKFPVGSLVRGKQNKRALRCGYAGLTGLVTESGSKYATVNWVGRPPSPYNNYPERDLELVSGV